MSRRLRNGAYIGLIAALLAVVVIGLVPRDRAPETPDERSHRIASELRCPFCNGESIADAQSSIAGDLRRLIDEQIASGMTDDEIYNYYVSIYTDRVLLSPPLFGWGTLLWALPLIVLVGGVGLLLGRKRSASNRVAISSRAALEDARHAVALDIAEVELQLAAGELDSAAAERLRATYEAERVELDGVEVVEQFGGRDRKRTLAGAAVLALGAAALTIGVVVTVSERAPGDLITGGIASPNEGRDLATVTNEEMEAVIAANPDVIPMRLALAGRYFDEGDFSSALGHYLEVLDRENNPEALANVGWMTYLSGDIETGLAFVERSLEVSRDLPQSYWFLANIRFWGLSDAAGAVEPLETLLAFEQIPAEIRDAASELLTEVRAAL